MGYTVMNKLNISEELMRLPIRKEEFIKCGYTPENLPPPGTLVARVELMCTKLSTSYWRVEAIIRTGLRIMDWVKVGEIKCDSGTSGSDVLELAGSWIRSHEEIANAPACKIQRRPTLDCYLAGYLVMGVTLFRG